MRLRFAALARSALLLGAVAMVPVGTAGLAAVDASVSPKFARLFTVYQLVKSHYVDQTDDDKLVKGAIDGMLASLDPHSAYLDGPNLERLRTMIDGGYAGLGLSVVQDDGAVKVVAPMHGSPAEKAGVKPGDYITHLDGKFIVDGDLDEAVAKMRGEPGTQIRLTIYRPGRDAPFDLTLTRAVITLEPVTGKLEGSVAVVTVNEFSHDVGRLVFDQLRKLRTASGGKITGVVLDLRSNPGGELDEAVALSDLFLSSGIVVSQRGRQAGENMVYRAETMFTGDAVKNTPVVVLIDAGSASASEIVAGACRTSTARW